MSLTETLRSALSLAEEEARALETEFELSRSRKNYHLWQEAERTVQRIREILEEQE